MKEIKCINCGAPLNGNVCEYCGTQYEDNKISCEIGDYQGIITIGDNSYNVYIGDVSMCLVGSDSYRDADGNLIRKVGTLKHKFTLIEM